MKKRLAVLFTLLVFTAITLCGCSVPGTIGDIEYFFKSNLKLTEYREQEATGENGEITISYTEEESEKTKTSVVNDLADEDLEYASYASIGLTFNSSASAQAEITTITFEIKSEQSGLINFVIMADDEILYESGLKELTANRTSSFVISEISYPASTSTLYFKNKIPDDMQESDYEGYELSWKLMYLQLVYNGRE